MRLIDFFDEKLVDLLNRYSDTQESVGTNLLNVIKNSGKSEVIIPVLGMQGMGKSTLINGLLEDNILPNDADETTCVPVEVKFGANECAKVHFFDKTNVITIHTREELNEYVDNNYNPGNEKRVANIELFRNNPLLSNGMVIVDLPGVGSLTKENENTTKRYVENLCSAIFVIPTVPTIRNKEALFIKSLWSQFSKAIFVQNDWGETRDEIEESLDFNNKVLNKIADELHYPYSNEILLVNAYNAIYGALTKNQAMVQNSNIKALYDKLLELSSKWETERERVLTSRTKMCMEYAKGIILKKISDIGKSKEEIEQENRKTIENFIQGTIEIRDKIDSVKRYLREQEDEVFFAVRIKSKECVKKIRAAIFKVIDGGVYDGEYLSTAFNDIQEEETKDFMNDIIDTFMNIKFEVESRFDEIQQIELNNEFKVHKESFNTESSFKWEKGFQVFANIGGAVTGALGAGAATGAIYSALGIAAASGPAGWVVAGVGLAIYGVFSLVGWGVKKTTQAHRANDAKKQIAPHIDEIERKLIKLIPEKYNEFASSCNTALDNILKCRENELMKLKQSLSVDVDNGQEATLKADLEYIVNKLKEI